MLTLGPRSYRSSNLVLDLKMWEKFESNLPVCNSLRFLKWKLYLQTDGNTLLIKDLRQDSMKIMMERSHKKIDGSDGNNPISDCFNKPSK